jgi:type VI protein secretion system component VasF
MRTKALLFALLITGAWFVPSPAAAQNQHGNQTGVQRPQPALPPDSQVPVSNESLNPQQKLSIMQLNFNKAKNDAVELAALAKELREELNKPKADALSPEVVSRAEKIEKLAKRIREETKAY